ncbi:MAG: hypothetical protein HN855_14450 [Anaerolineae bacterium]|jgi:uncharacterized protein|nr:hypothetical protein [Anaerolineae bacterium]MBT7326355.1 hypothetical protein [Anaerolineae bacterium]
MSATFQLYRLQQVDSQIDKAQKRLDEIQRIIENNTELKRAKAYLANCESSHQSTEKTLRQAEAEVKKQHVKIEQTEAMLYGGTIKNPKEIQDLQNKSESLKRYLSSLQDVQLEAMLAHEEESETLQSAQSALDALKAKLIQQNSQLAGEQGVLDQEKERLLKERSIAQPAVPEELLTKYDQLRKQKNGVAISSILDGSCSACGAMLTQSHQQKARSTLVYCPSCKRMIYAS